MEEDKDYKDIMDFLEHIDLREYIINNTLYYWYTNEPEVKKEERK